MTAERPRVVFDCVVYVQALISGRGPSAACIEEIKRGAAALLISPQIMAEVREVPLRPALSGRYKHLTREFIETFVKDVERYAASIASAPRAFPLPRDKKDEPYLDLAIAAAARYLVTWNERHLTYLMKQDTPEGREFCRRFPDLRIVDPPTFLRLIRQQVSPP